MSTNLTFDYSTLVPHLYAATFSRNRGNCSRRILDQYSLKDIMKRNIRTAKISLVLRPLEAAGLMTDGPTNRRWCRGRTVSIDTTTSLASHIHTIPPYFNYVGPGFSCMLD
ncbi:hypothetical protein EVAR_62893_1 [Eumeta japonica]|uniref:Uncharacterized protein n=1 Tax=Eumeta variegata TaxID=151549 RepID=A0A4C1Y6X1_EUMVA|nr:hypothetical protein EVAR_62893_1 [Eumeta japonica]